jgi:hypothetical protein
MSHRDTLAAAAVVAAVLGPGGPLFADDISSLAIDGEQDLTLAAVPGLEPGAGEASWRLPADGSRSVLTAESFADRALLTVDAESVHFGMLQDEEPAAASPASAGPHADDQHEGLAEQATNPIASLVQIQFQAQYNGDAVNGSGSSGNFTVQPVVPWTLGDLTMLSRFTLPVFASTPDLGGTTGREYGIGDFVALNAMVFNIKDGPWKGMYGPIASFTLPTASSDFIGEGKYQAGPGGIYINTATKGFQWGIFGYQQWSFASSGGDEGRKEVSKLFFQPICTKHFEGGWYIALQDLLWTIDWNDNARFSLPTGFRFGRVTKAGFLGDQPVNIFIMPWYDISGNNKGNEWGIKFSISLLFPTK